ncbi:MAG: hypothetical protein QNL12_12670 [Acidimicrobiia bacterium]|nr:hypothetical protein [Acidimicrobiia bacterium]
MDFSKLSQNHKIALGGGVLAIISLFLPWYGFSIAGFGGANISAFDSGFFAWSGLLLAIAGATILALKAFEINDVKVGKLAAEQFSLVLAGLGAVFILLRFVTQIDLVKYGLFAGLIAAGLVADGAFGSMKDAGLEMPTADDFKSSGDN